MLVGSIEQTLFCFVVVPFIDVHGLGSLPLVSSSKVNFLFSYEVVEIYQSIVSAFR